jgi:peptidoglycan hydrolase CwlO-like protein
MLKKTLIIGGIVLLVGGIIAGKNARSYVKTSVSRVKHAFKDNVPIEYEIDRARTMIKDLRPEIEQNMKLIAQEEVEVEKLRRQIESGEEQLAKCKGDILRLTTDLDEGGSVFTYAGHTFTKSEVESDLSNRFERFKTKDATVLNLKKVLTAREKGLDAARQKLDGMLAAKRQLEVNIENLEARLTMVEVAQTTSEFNFDESHLSRTKELIDEIQTRIDVAERLVNAETHFADEIPLDAEEGESDITADVAEYFGADREPNLKALAEVE